MWHICGSWQKIWKSSRFPSCTACRFAGRMDILAMETGNFGIGPQVGAAGIGTLACECSKGIVSCIFRQKYVFQRR